MSGFTRYPDINFTGGSGGTGSASETLSDFEIAGLTGEDVNSPNTILDTYNSDISTKLNSEIVASAIQLEVGQNSGTVEHTLNVSPDMTSVKGGMVIPLHAMPVQSVSGNDMVLTGDATSVLPDNSRVIIMQKTTQLNRVTHTGLMDNDNKVARLVVSSTSYNLINDETTVTLTNLTPALDLSMGIAAPQQPDELRIAPFDWDLEASATGTGAYEEMDITDLHGLDTLRFTGTAGSSIIEEISAAINGSCDHIAIRMSENGTYGVIRIWENISGNQRFHWWYTGDSGVNWTKFGTTEDFTNTENDEMGGQYHQVNQQQIAVANNGKIFLTYPYVRSGNFSVEGYYADLTDVTPTLTATPSTGAGAGIIRTSGSVSFGSALAWDKEDLSLVVCVVQPSNPSFSTEYHSFTNGGATHLGLASNTQVAYQNVIHPHLSGTAGAHRFHMVYRDNTSGQTRVVYIDEVTHTSISAYTFTSAAGSSWPIATAINDTYLMLVEWNTGQNLYYSYVEHGASTTFSSSMLMTADMPMDRVTMFGSIDNKNLFRNIQDRLVSDPNDDKHFFLTYIHNEDNGAYNPLVYEFQDITLNPGITSAVVGNNATINHRNNSGAEANGLIFTTSGTEDIRGVGFKAWSNDANFPWPDNATITATIESTTGGTPDNSPATTYGTDTISLNRFRRESSGTGQWLHFNFDGISLPAGTYFIKLEASFPIDATGFLKFAAQSGNPNPNTSSWFFDGASWTEVAGQDLTHYISDMWISAPDEFVGRQTDRDVYVSAYDSSIQQSSPTELAVGWTRTTRYTDPTLPFEGDSVYRIMTMESSSSVRSKFPEAEKPVIHSETEFDPYRYFQVSLGNQDTRSINPVTGVFGPDSDAMNETGFGHDIETGVNFTMVADTDFESGRCAQLTGSEYRRYTFHEGMNIMSQKFAIECEAKWITNPGNNGRILEYMDAAQNNGWGLYTTVAGKVVFRLRAGGGGADTVSTETLNTSEYTKIRVIGDEEEIRIYFSRGADIGAGPGGTDVFTEVSYDSQRTGGYVQGNINENITIGRTSAGGSDFFIGKLGFIKLNIGSDSFVDEGYSDQQYSTNTLQAGGDGTFLCKRVRGQTQNTDFTKDTFFHKLGGGLFTDSYDIFLEMEKVLGAAGKQLAVRTTMRRGTGDVKTNEQGRLLTFSK